MKKIKKLCEIKKVDYKLYREDIISIVKKPFFMCKKCLRVANEERYLCKADKM